MKQYAFLILLLIVSNSILHAQDTIEVSAGWNNIGAVSTISLSDIRSEPPGIVTSSYYGYSSGYFSNDTLKKGKGYWVKTSQSGLLILEPAPELTCGDTVAYSGKTYNTIQIGAQCWFKENLDVGTMIPGGTAQTNNSTIEKYCYDNNPSNCSTYGGLYSWNEAMQYSNSSGSKGICPSGWHIPTSAEYQTLKTTVSNNGNALKEVGQGTGAGTGTNTSGFSALLSGFRDYNSEFYTLTYNVFFWSSAEFGGADAYCLDMNNTDSAVGFSGNDKGYGYSIRCIKN